MLRPYESPYSNRYASDAMRRIWSEENKRLLWRKLWVALAETQAEFGLVTPAQAADLRTHMTDLDLPRALEIEAEIKHDVMAEVRTFAEQCPLGGGIIHLGMTSMDIVDNADALRVRDSLGVILEKLRDVLGSLGLLINQWAATPVMAFTHLQPAEPTTLGYRLAQYGQDLLGDWHNLVRMRAGLRGKGVRGAVGTSASFAELLGADRLPEFETRFAEILGMPFFPAVTQTYPRKQDYEVASALAGLGASLYKFAFDLRILQSPPIGELAEPFGAQQVGSSAMPFKRNPINAEKIDSLARWLAQFPRTAWDNAAHSLLERTLDDSANRRTTLPEAFLIADEILITAHRILKDIRVNEPAIQRNMQVYGPFAATERVLMAAVKAGKNRPDGADRQVLHERLRAHSLAAWERTQSGETNDLAMRISADPEFTARLSPQEIASLMDASHHIGDAPRRARQVAGMIAKAVNEPTSQPMNQATYPQSP